jgi:hypothetical protein
MLKQEGTQRVTDSFAQTTGTYKQSIRRVKPVGGFMAYIRWTEKEYDAVIDAYCKMWLDQRRGEPVDISQATRECVAALKDSRNYNAVRRRFSNISYIFSFHGLDYVNNLKPLENISYTCAEFIWNKAQKRLERTN